MNLSEPLETLFSSLEARALRSLARIDHPMSGRQVASVIGTGTPANVRKALIRLLELGLVRARSTPAATLYSANREHLLWAAVEAGVSARDLLISRMMQLKRFGPDGTAVWLFGSVARGESTAHSDVDVFIVYPNGRIPALREGLEHAIRTDVSLWTGNRVEIIAVENREFTSMRAAGDPLVSSVETDAIVVFGPLPSQIGTSVF